MSYLKNYWRIINFGYYFRYHPYFYSKEKKMLLFNPSKKIYNRFILSIFMMIIYELFMAFQAIQVQYSEDVSPAAKIRTIALTVIYILFNFNHIITLKNYGEHHDCINTVLKITSQIKENSVAGAGRRLDKKTKKLERSVSVLCVIYGVLSVAIGIVRGLKVFTNPTERVMLTSVAKNRKGLPIWIKIPLALLHSHLGFFHAYFWAFHSTTFYCFTAAMVTTIHQTKKPRDSENLQELTNLEMTIIHKNYFKLSVLQSFFTSIYGIWLLGCEILVIFYSITHIFLGVLFKNIWPGILGIATAMILLSLFSSFAEVHSLSTNSIQSWKIGMRRSTWFAKFQRSCQPLKIQIGSFFYADQALVLTIISVIINNATSLIISYKDHTPGCPP